MNLKAIVPILALTFVIFGCNSGTKNQSLETKITSLEAKIESLEQANKDLSSQVEMLSYELLKIGDWERVAFMTPGDKGYSTVRFDLGVIAVKLADIKPYANGSKITLTFGNLTSARIIGLKAKFDWGKVDEKGVAQNDKAKSREVTFEESLMPGTWTNSDLVLEGIPPTDLGFVRIREIGHRAIWLMYK